MLVRKFTKVFTFIGDGVSEEQRDAFGNFVLILDGCNYSILKALQELLYTGRAFINTEESKEALLSFLNEDVIAKTDLNFNQTSSVVSSESEVAENCTPSIKDGTTTMSSKPSDVVESPQNTVGEPCCQTQKQSPSKKIDDPMQPKMRMGSHCF